MVTQHIWTNLKGLSCSLLLLFGTFALLILSAALTQYILNLSTLWPSLLVLSVCLIGVLSWMQLTAVQAENRIEGEGPSPNIISTIPTITGLLNGRGSPVHYPPPPPYCEACSYKPTAARIAARIAAVCNGHSPEEGSAPPPSYDEAIISSDSANMYHAKQLGDQNTRTCDPHDMVRFSGQRLLL